MSTMTGTLTGTLTSTLHLNEMPLGETTQAAANETAKTDKLSARREQVKAAQRKRSKRASRNIFLSATALILAIFVLIGLSAYAASIQHANNVLQEENAYIQAEIDSLNSQIVDATKVTKIEKIATEEYGMIYPTAENCIVISEDSESGENLAAVIRSEAYN